jgi:hypothetical protein
VPSHRSPKGVYSRSSPDWFGDRTCFVGDFTDIGSTGYYTSTWFLTNNDAQGRYFALFALSLYTDGSDATLVGYPETPAGTLVTPPRYIRLDQGQAPGKFSRLDTLVGGGNSINTDVKHIITALPSLFAGALIEYGAPLWLLPANATMAFGSEFPAGPAAIAIWYTLLAGN